MDKRAGELDQAFVEKIVALAALAEPEFFEHVVRFVKELLVEALEITKVMRVPLATAQAVDHCCNADRFFAHGSVFSLIQRRAFNSPRGSEPGGLIVTGMRRFNKL